MKNEHLLGGKLLACGIAVAVATALAAMAYAYWYGICDQEKCGQFGDFLGGVLNPVIGAVTLGALAWTVRTQNETLRLTRQALLLAESEARDRIAENAKAEKERLNERDKARAIDTFDMLLRKTEELLARPVLPWDAPDSAKQYSFLAALDGAVPPESLAWWGTCPPEQRDARTGLYVARINQLIATLTLAAAKAKPYLSDVYWIEVRSRMKLFLVMIVDLRFQEKDYVLLLADHLGIEDLSFSTK